MPYTTCRGKKYWREAAAPPYLFQDEFLLADPNPLTNPRLSEPGPGTFDVVDLDGRLAVAGGALTFAGASAAWDRTYLSCPIAWSRKRGRFLEWQFTPTNVGDMTVAWQKSASGLINGHEAGLRIGGGGFVLAQDGLDPVAVQWPYTAGTPYAFRVYDEGTEFLLYARAVSSSTWTLLWRKRLSASPLVTLFIGLNNIALTGTFDYLRVRNGKIKGPAAFVAAVAVNQDVCGAADGLHEVEITAPSSGSPALVFRKTDADNLWKLVLNRAGNTMDLVKVALGTPTTVGTTAIPWTTGERYVFRALTFADKIRTFLGRAAGTLATDGFNQTAMLAGTLADARYDNLRVDTGGNLTW